MNSYEIASGSVVLDCLTYYYRIVKHATNDNNGDSWFCGYVSIPESNWFSGLSYDDVQEFLMPDVELSYSNGYDVFGFDTHHVGMENLTYDDVYDMTMDLLHDFHIRGNTEEDVIDSP